MVNSKQKPFDEILKITKGEKKHFLVGCSECATICKSGGREQLLEMERLLRQAGKKITGLVVLKLACHDLNTKVSLKHYAEEIKLADSILSFACGVGTQTVQEFVEKIVHPCVNTLFVGHIKRFGEFEERCVMCGECILDQTAGICVYARCPKGLVNGPCGGAKDGKCEVNSEIECIWQLIYERLKKAKSLNKIPFPLNPRDYTKIVSPRQLKINVTSLKTKGSRK
ncbi:MAG: methylenetetrahydrofolate reductase C-terminal domain-containing protein [Candidatus Edwardsbacteria bacterium]